MRRQLVRAPVHTTRSTCLTPTAHTPPPSPLWPHPFLRAVDPSVPARYGMFRPSELVQNGFVHIKGVCTDAQVAELVSAIDIMPIDERNGDMDADGVKSLRNPWNRSMLFVGYLDRDPVAVVAEQSLGSGSGPGGGNSPAHHNHVVSMVATKAAPGAAAPDDGLHLDFLPMEVDSDLLASGEVEMPMFITTAVYCLTSGPAEVGVVPGSHLAGRAPNPGEQSFHGDTPTRLVVDAGDVIMFRCESWKCIFANEVRFLCSSLAGEPSFPLPFE